MLWKGLRTQIPANIARYSALADAGSRSIASSMTLWGTVAFIVRVAACQTRIGPGLPKYFRTTRLTLYPFNVVANSDTTSSWPLYEIRNNRGVGHVGGDVDPNLMDATAVYSMSSSIMAELVRIFHNVSTTAAQEAVDALVERKLPLIWSPGTHKRVLDTKLKAAAQTLLLLHQALGWVEESELLASVEYSKASLYRSNVLRRLHKQRLIEYDAANNRAKISPKGSAHIEKTVLKSS